MDTKNRILFYGSLIIGSVAGIWFTYNFAQDFSEFAIVLAYTALIIGLWDVFDTFILKRIDTVTELKKGNTAYAIFLLALAVLFHAIATVVW